VVTSGGDSPDYAAMAAWLDWLQDVPTTVLTTSVVFGGLCLLELWPPVEPDWEDCAPRDRTLAKRLCEGCPVIDQCLELELRTAGTSTTGVWGALAEDDRRALHRVWRNRRQHHDQEQDDQDDQDGGATP
jgi:WhiB family redox-sensing transcriptional regulator